MNLPSHIFCIACSDNLSLSKPAGSARICPACQTALTNPNDAVVAQLNPTEDYKTSVLSGLSPGVIMECAGRGLAFYSYQATQEILYQEYLSKRLTDKYSNLSTEMDKIIHDANTEIIQLREKLSSVQAACRALDQKNQELADQHLIKSKAHSQTLKMYNTLKAQIMASQVANAASDNAEQAIQTATGSHFTDRVTSRRSTGSADFSRLPEIAGGDPLLHQRRRSGSIRDLGARAFHNQYPAAWPGYAMSGQRGLGSRMECDA